MTRRVEAIEHPAWDGALVLGDVQRSYQVQSIRPVPSGSSMPRLAPPITGILMRHETRGTVGVAEEQEGRLYGFSPTLRKWIFLAEGPVKFLRYELKCYRAANPRTAYWIKGL